MSPYGRGTLVALFVRDLGAGGAQRVMLTLAAALAGAGFAVDLVLVQAQGPLLEQVPEAVRVVNLHAGRARRAVKPLAAYLGQARPSVLLSTLNYVNVVALRAAARAARAGVKVPVVVREANVVVPQTYPGLRGALMLALMRRAYPRARAVIVNSVDTRTGLVSRRVVRPEQVRVIGNPIDVERVQRLAAETPEHPWLASRPRSPSQIIISVGSLSSQKDFPTLLRAVARLRVRRTNVRAVILGEGLERPRLERLIEELGLGESVSMPGYLANPYACIARADVFCLPSLYEGSPNVVLEAMALGVPVVATDCPGGAKELLEWGRLGPLVRPGDGAALADTLGRSLDSPIPGDRLQARAGEFQLPAILARYLTAMGLPPAGSTATDDPLN